MFYLRMIYDLSLIGFLFSIRLRLMSPAKRLTKKTVIAMSFLLWYLDDSWLV
jgi:hypothetical protein